MDAGAIYAQEAVALTGRETTGSLTEECAVKGARLMAKVLSSLELGGAVATPQNDAQATFCHLIKKDDGVIDWNQPAVQLSGWFGPMIRGRGCYLF